MPFIPQANRKDIDPILQQLWDLICPKGTEIREVKGDINYCFFKFLVSLVRRHEDTSSPTKASLSHIDLQNKNPLDDKETLQRSSSRIGYSYRDSS